MEQLLATFIDKFGSHTHAKQYFSPGRMFSVPLPDPQVGESVVGPRTFPIV